MIRALTVLVAVVALAVTAAPAYAINDGTSNTRLAAAQDWWDELLSLRFRPPTSPPTPPGVPIPYPNFAGPIE